MKEAKKKDPLATKESMTVLHNVEARRQEHDALKREQGLPEEQDPNAMRYQRYSEMETDEQGKIMHNKPPWVVNEASEMIAEINDEDAPTYKKSDKARNRAGKDTASVTKALFNSEGQNYGGVIAPQRYEIVEKESPEERAKRKSGTGLAPTSTQLPDDWKTPASVEQGKETRSKRYLPDEENSIENTDMEKGHEPGQGDRDTYVNPNTGAKAASLKGTKDRIRRSPEFAARRAAQHGGLESDWAQGTEQYQMGKLTKALINLQKKHGVSQRRTPTGYSGGEGRVGSSVGGPSPAPPIGDEPARTIESVIRGKPVNVVNPKWAEWKQRATGDVESIAPRFEDMEKGAGSDQSMGWKERRTPEYHAAKDPTMAIRRDAPTQREIRESGQDVYTHTSGKGKTGRDKKSEMINNYIASLNKAGVPQSGGTGHQFAGSGSIYEPEQQEREDWEERGIREFVPEYDEKTGKELAPTNVENFLPLAGLAAGAVAGAGKKLLTGGDDEGDMEMTEKGDFGSGGHAREQQRRFNRMSSGQKKRYGGMGAMGFSPSKSKSKKERRN